MSEPPLTNAQRDEIKLEGLRRRAAYIKKHPREKVKVSAPTGWDEPMKPQKQRRKSK